MYNNIKEYRKVDFWLVACWVVLIFAGWLNIYSAVYSEEHPFILDLSQRYGMQFIWVLVAIGFAVSIVYIINSKIYTSLPPLFYIAMLVLLLLVAFCGREVNGSKSWFFIGPFGFQPAEFSKITTALFLAYTMSRHGFSLYKTRDAINAAIVVLLPILLIILEKETGSAMVYVGLILVFYLNGLSGWILILGLSIIALFIITLKFSTMAAIYCVLVGEAVIHTLITRKISPILLVIPIIFLLYFIPDLSNIRLFHFLTHFKPESWALMIIAGVVLYRLWECLWTKGNSKKYLLISFVTAIVFIFSVNFMFNNVLQPHQRARIEDQLGITEDLRGIGYNVHQSKIAIGSGGFLGKGYLNGTQTKYNFVPEQSTDFIFCTIGEEKGFVGALLVIAVYLVLIIRLLTLSYRQKDTFARIYGSCVAVIFAMHFFINIGMTIGIVPVIGIPLPFLSYGGSSMLSFTILLFIFIRLDGFTQNQA